MIARSLLPRFAEACRGFQTQIRRTINTEPWEPVHIGHKMYTITLLGDIMLGRLVDQLLPNHVDEPEDAGHAAHFRKSYPHLQRYGLESPWGNSLAFFQKSDLVLGNLETAATTHAKKWPNKVFNYRMHPANIDCLKAAKIAYVSLANNHTLDFGREGLHETVETLENAGIAYAGAGRFLEEAVRPAVLRLPRTSHSAEDTRQDYEIHLYSFSDHPSDWKSVSEFNLVRYDSDSRAKLKELLNAKQPELTSSPALKIVSIHWGPNYSWKPDDDIQSLARFLIDDCAVDLIHGHSSHHIQGLEVYKQKPIIYGCGDFVDDYAVNPQYRNDLSAAWNVLVAESAAGKLESKKLEIFPNRIRKFRANLLTRDDSDHDVVCDRFRALCGEFGTEVSPDLGEQGQLIVNIPEAE